MSGIVSILYRCDHQAARWSHRYNARTKSEGAVVRSPNQPKIFFQKDTMPITFFIKEIKLLS